MSPSRNGALPASVEAAGGITAWNKQDKNVAQLYRMLNNMCKATSVDEALTEVEAVMQMGHNLWAYAYMRMLYHKNRELYYATLLAKPQMLLPVVYTPTVGEACQKFGKMPFYPRGCYISIAARGNIKDVLAEYAEVGVEKDEDGKPICECIVFSDGGRILGLGDLGAWGMGIPIGKLDLYTVCAGVNPRRTIPVIIDAGCYDACGNTDKVVVRDDPLYTGEKKRRLTEVSAAGTVVNSAYYGPGNMIEEFMQAAVDLFGKSCLLQFEDFNSNDAFPLLAEYRNKFLTYNDDIQGTAAVALAGLLGAIKLRDPEAVDLIPQLAKESFLFHGAGSANLGTLSLLRDEAGVPASQLAVTNSRGVIWKSEDGSEGSFRNDEQKEFARVGKPSYDSKDLATVILNTRATCVVGAVGCAPGCFDRKVVEATADASMPKRPIIFALSNPKTKAEISSTDAYNWSGGTAIYGSGTAMESVEVSGKMRNPGQVNNVYIFPGMSFAAICCKARTIPERFFMVAAEAVANTLDDEDIKADRVVPHPDRLREVGLNVAIAVVLEAQKLGLAERTLGEDRAGVAAALRSMMWEPEMSKRFSSGGFDARLLATSGTPASLSHCASSDSDMPTDDFNPHDSCI